MHSAGAKKDVWVLFAANAPYHGTKTLVLGSLPPKARRRSGCHSGPPTRARGVAGVDTPPAPAECSLPRCLLFEGGMRMALVASPFPSLPVLWLRWIAMLQRPVKDH